MQSTTPQIRKYKPADLNKILEIIATEDRNSIGFVSEEILIKSKEGIKTTLSNNHSKAWVLELDRQIIGFASTIEQREDNKTLLIGLYVSKQYQNQGNGKKLLNKVKSLSNKIIELAVYQENTRAYEFYKRHGFSIKKESFEEGHKYLEMSWTKPIGVKLRKVESCQQGKTEWINSTQGC